MDPDRPKARALADLLREQIRGGQLAHGVLLPAEDRMAAEHDLGVGTVRRAVAVLRGEGLLVVQPPYGTRVRHPQRRRVIVPRGSSVRVVMPSPEERRTYGVPEGVAVILLTLPSGEVQVLPADEVDLTFA